MVDILPIGHNAFVLARRILWIAPLDGSAMKKLRQSKEEQGQLALLTYGRPAASIVSLDDRTWVVTAVSAQALKNRLLKHSGASDEEEK